MKGLILKHTAVLMAFLVMFSTVSVTIEKHYCRGHLMDVSIFAEADKCNMEMPDKPAMKFCCEDVVDVIEGQDELKLSPTHDFDFEKQQFTDHIIGTYTELFVPLPEEIVPFKHYNPPKLFKDIQVLNEVFLI